MSAANLAGHLQRFFTDRLLGQLGASPHTVASYRDTFRLLLKFASKHHHRQVSDLNVEDLDAKLVSSFLNYLEHERGNSIRSRNNRLSAIHAFFGHVCLHDMARVARSTGAASRGANRIAKLRTNQTATTRRAVRSRRPCSLSRKRSQGTMHSIAIGCCGTLVPMACRATSGPGDTDLSDSQRLRHEFGCASKAGCATLQNRREKVSLPTEEKSDSAHPTAHHSHGPSAAWSGYYSNRVVAGPRINPDHANLPPCRHGDEGKSFGSSNE